MDPVSGVVEKKVAEGVWAVVRGWINWHKDQRKRIEALEAELAEFRGGERAFEKLMSELVCRPEDDHMYWKKGNSGGPYCPICLHQNKQLIPLTHVRNLEGAFECCIHKQCFQTEERRQREPHAVRYSIPIKPHRRRHSWMGS